MTVENTGNVALASVVLDDPMTECQPTRIAHGDNDPADILLPGERWVFECSVRNINEDLRNSAEVQAQPVISSGQSTGQSPVDDQDVAHVSTEAKASNTYQKVRAACGHCKGLQSK